MTTSKPRPTTAQRVAAWAAIVTLVAAVAVVVLVALDDLGDIAVASTGVSLAIVGAWYASSRRGVPRVIALAAAVVGASMAAVTFVIAETGAGSWVLVGLAATASVLTGGFVLRSSRRQQEANVDTGAAPAPRPRHPVLLVNPKAGGGKVEEFELVRECRERGIEPVVLGPDDDLRQLAEDAVARGADAIGMAGGDGSQALVSAVASAHGIPHVVVPAGTRNHFALDLGLDRDDVVGALDAFIDGDERTIDLAEVNGRTFVNNATLGVYAMIMQSPDYREAKVQTAVEMLPELVGSDAEPLDLRFTGPDGEALETAAVILVSNGPYELQHAQGRGSRERIDDGVLGVVTVNLSGAADVQRLLSMQAIGQLDRFDGWREWTTERFEVASNDPVEVGLDGEALTMDPPLLFTTRPGALRVRMPRHASGLSPAAAAVHVTSSSAPRQLARIAAGRVPSP